MLAMIGIGFLFTTAIGFVQIAPRSTADELARAFVDTMGQGLIVPDIKGRIVYANQAYAQMTGATSAADVLSVDGRLSDNPEASPTVYRLAAGLRDGVAGDGGEEPEIAGAVAAILQTPPEKKDLDTAVLYESCAALVLAQKEQVRTDTWKPICAALIETLSHENTLTRTKLVLSRRFAKLFELTDGAAKTG